MKFAIFAASALALAASASAMIIEPNQGLESRDMSPPMPVGFADKPCIKFKRARALVWISDKPGHSKKELCDRFIAGCNFGMNWEKYCEVSKKNPNKLKVRCTQNDPTGKGAAASIAHTHKILTSDENKELFENAGKSGKLWVPESRCIKRQ